MEDTSAENNLSDEKSPEPTGEWFTFCSLPLNKQIPIEDLEGFEEIATFKSCESGKEALEQTSEVFPLTTVNKKNSYSPISRTSMP